MRYVLPHVQNKDPAQRLNAGSVFLFFLFFIFNLKINAEGERVKRFECAGCFVWKGVFG